MKLKNIAKDVRQLTDRGQIIMVKPGQIIEVSKPKFEENTFKVIHTQKSTEQDINKKEVKLNGTSNRTGRMDRNILSNVSA